MPIEKHGMKGWEVGQFKVLPSEARHEAYNLSKRSDMKFSCRRIDGKLMKITRLEDGPKRSVGHPFKKGN